MARALAHLRRRSFAAVTAPPPPPPPSAPPGVPPGAPHSVPQVPPTVLPPAGTPAAAATPPPLPLGAPPPARPPLPPGAPPTGEAPLHPGDEWGDDPEDDDIDFGAFQRLPVVQQRETLFTAGTAFMYSTALVGGIGAAGVAGAFYFTGASTIAEFSEFLHSVLPKVDLVPPPPPAGPPPPLPPSA